jgi:hypothetical protein
MRKIQLLTVAFASSILLVSCGGNAEKNSNDKSLTDSAKSTAASGGATGAPARATIDVTITGGDMKGSYSAACSNGCCSWGIAGKNVFGNQYSETGKGPKELSSVQLIVDDVKEGSKSTKEFTLTVSFGELFSKNGRSFNINTRNGNKKGSGTLDLHYAGNQAEVTIKGVSEEGPSIDLKMKCNNVMSPDNMAQ